MSDSNVSDVVREIIAEQLNMDIENVKYDSSLLDDLGASSSDMAVIIGELEELFDLEIPESDVVELNTVGDIISYVEENKD